MATIKLRNNPTTAGANASAIIPAVGEPLANVQTGEIRIGDGVHTWANLPSALAGAGAPSTADVLTTGEMVPARDALTSVAFSHATGNMGLAMFTAAKSETVTTLTAYTGTTPAAATPTLCRMGVYSIAANGDGTLIGSTANDTTLFAAASTAYARALTAPFAKVAGQRYATALLVVSAVAVPTWISSYGVFNAAIHAINALAPARTARLTGQVDLPASFTAASLGGYYFRAAMLLS